MSLNIAMIGTGYVGLVSGACFADFGHTVTCVDIDQDKIESLESGNIPIFEPGLKDLVAANVDAGRLSFTTALEGAVAEADVVFIAVGTPSRRGDGHADLTYVYQAARMIAEHVNGYTVIVTKSTVPVGTGDEVNRVMREVRSEAEFSVVSNPEFLREGAAIEDFRRPDRVVVGLQDARSEDVMRAVYRPLSLNDAPLMFTDRRTAELIKYASNAFLAMKITFINELADLSEKVGTDVQALARGIGLDNRIGSKFLHAGPGYGGSCFPKDTLALTKTAQDYESPLKLVETTISINDQRKRAMSRRVIAACGGDVRGKRIGILGLTFKPNTDDMRDAPSVSIIQGLQDAGASISAYDPEGVPQATSILENVHFVEDAYEAARLADCLVLVTEWNEFRTLDLLRLKTLMSDPIFVDLRNVYRSQEFEQLDFKYFSVGRGQNKNNSIGEVGL